LIPISGKHPKFPFVKDLLKFVGEGETGLLSCIKSVGSGFEAEAKLVKLRIIMQTDIFGAKQLQMILRKKTMLCFTPKAMR
jgi:hypothetical protein